MSLYEITVKDISGKDVAMSEFAGKVLLIVNTATECGFTPQYGALQELYERFRDRDFEVLDFPCNQFGHQAPGTEDEIKSFCETKFGVTFRQFAKIDVNGENESPLYTFLKAHRGGALGSRIKWNFTKFLVDRNGEVIDRFASTTKPELIADEIKKFL
jgi:glutathione peroxidase